MQEERFAAGQTAPLTPLTDPFRGFTVRMVTPRVSNGSDRTSGSVGAAAAARRRDAHPSASRPAGIGVLLLRLLADEDVPRILRALRDSGPMSFGALKQRLADVPASTLAKWLQRACGAGAVSRHDSPQTDQPIVYRVTDLGRDLHALFGSAHAWVVRGPGAAADEPGRLSLTSRVLGLLADDAARAVLHAVDEGADRPAALERELRDLSHDRIVGVLRKHESLRLIDREGRPGGRRPIHVTSSGREAVAFVAVAGRLEQRYCVPGAAAPAPAETARLLCFAAPLIDPRARERGVFRITVEPQPDRPAEPASFLIQTGSDAGDVDLDSVPDAAVSAEAPGTVGAWCRAVLDGDRSEIAVAGNAGLADRLVAALHARLFPCWGPRG